MDHAYYHKRADRTTEKAYNGYVKAYLIQTFVPKHAVVVDLGCGWAQDQLKYAHTQARAVFFSDVREDAIAEAKKRYEKLKPGYPADFRIFDFCHDTPYLQEGIADAVCFHLSLQHARPPTQLEYALKVAAHFLRPGGTLIVTIPSGDEVLRRGTHEDNPLYSLALNDGVSYTFSTKWIRCTEYVITADVLTRIAAACELELVSSGGFLDVPRDVELLKAMRVDPDGLDEHERGLVSLYAYFVFSRAR